MMGAAPVWGLKTKIIKIYSATAYPTLPRLG